MQKRSALIFTFMYFSCVYILFCVIFIWLCWAFQWVFPHSILVHTAKWACGYFHLCANRHCEKITANCPRAAGSSPVPSC